MNDMTLFLDLILIASGAYCMYTFLRLAVTKRLFKNGLLVPKEKKISDCADEQMYIGYMMPPLAVMAVSGISRIMPWLLGFSAGAMLYVVVEELIPEMSQGAHSNIGTVFFAVGFSLMMVLDVALG